MVSGTRRNSLFWNSEMFLRHKLRFVLPADAGEHLSLCSSCSVQQLLLLLASASHFSSSSAPCLVPLPSHFLCPLVPLSLMASADFCMPFLSYFLLILFFDLGLTFKL